MAGFVHPQYLVETDWLERHLTDPKVVVLDCTTHLIPNPAITYDVVPGRELGGIHLAMNFLRGRFAQDRIILEKHCDVKLKEDDEVLMIVNRIRDNLAAPFEAEGDIRSGHRAERRTGSGMRARSASRAGRPRRATPIRSPRQSANRWRKWGWIRKHAGCA